MKRQAVPPTDLEGPPSRLDVYATWIDEEAAPSEPARRARADDEDTSTRRPKPAARRR